MKNNMREPLWEGMARVFTRWLAARMLDSDTVTAVLGVYRDDYVEELTGFSSGDWQACRVKAVEGGAEVGGGHALRFQIATALSIVSPVAEQK